MIRASVAIWRLSASEMGCAVSCARVSGEAARWTILAPCAARSPEVLRKRPGHLPAKLGQVEFRQPAVQDAVGIVDLAVAEQMNSGLGHVYQFLKDVGRFEIFYSR